MGALEKDRERSQSMQDDDDLSNKEDYGYEMNEGEKRLKHFYNSKANLQQDFKKTTAVRLKSYENFNNLSNPPSFIKKPSSNNILNHGKTRTEPVEQNPVNKHEIIWDYTIEGWMVRPVVDVEIGSNDFSSSCMQFFLWAPKDVEEGEGDKNKFESLKLKKDVENVNDVYNEESEESVKMKVIKNKLIGECYININKLFKDDIRAVSLYISNHIYIYISLYYYIV